ACGRVGAALFPFGSFGPDGRFEFSGLEPGRYTISATTQDGRAGRLEGVELGGAQERTDLRIELGPAARLTLRRKGGPRNVEYVLRIGDAPVLSGSLADGV